MTGPVERHILNILSSQVTCEWCLKGAPHHTVGYGGIGAANRYTAYDLHEISDASGVGLAECTDAWLYDRRLRV